MKERQVIIGYMKTNDLDKKVNDFIVFCLELYKEKEKITGEEHIKFFKSTKYLSI